MYYRVLGGSQVCKKWLRRLHLECKIPGKAVCLTFPNAAFYSQKIHVTNDKLYSIQRQHVFRSSWNDVALTMVENRDVMYRNADLFP